MYLISQKNGLAWKAKNFEDFIRVHAQLKTVLTKDVLTP